MGLRTRAALRAARGAPGGRGGGGVWWWAHFRKHTNINHNGLQRTANEYAEERRIYKDLISKNDK